MPAHEKSKPSLALTKMRAHFVSQVTGKPHPLDFKEFGLEEAFWFPWDTGELKAFARAADGAGLLGKDVEKEDVGVNALDLNTLNVALGAKDEKGNYLLGDFGEVIDDPKKLRSEMACIEKGIPFFAIQKMAMKVSQLAEEYDQAMEALTNATHGDPKKKPSGMTGG